MSKQYFAKTKPGFLEALNSDIARSELAGYISRRYPVDRSKIYNILEGFEKMGFDYTVLEKEWLAVNMQKVINCLEQMKLFNAPIPDAEVIKSYIDIQTPK